MKFDNLPHANAALAIFPSVDGFGWILFDGPIGAVDWGVCTLAKKIRGSDKKNARCMVRVEALLKEFRPPMIVMEAFEGPGTKRHERIKRLCRSVISAATMGGATIRIISREEIRACFKSSRAKTRHQVAVVVASYIKEIRHRLPEKRKIWNGEDANSALMNATALLIAHYANSQEPL